MAARSWYGEEEMKNIKRFGVWMVCLQVLLCLVAIADEEGLIHPIQVATVVQRDMDQSVHVYGQVSFDEAWVQQINLAYRGQIVALPVVAGERVKKGQVVAEISVDPVAASGYQQAITAVRFAKSDVMRVRQLLTNQLATQSQLAVAEKILADSQVQLRELRSRSLGQSLHAIRAPFEAIVSNVMVQDKQRVLKGATLMQLSHPQHLKVLLGVDSANIRHVQSGNTVTLYDALYARNKVHTVVDQVLHTFNPQTRLVDVLVRLTGQTADSFLVGMPIAADITIKRFEKAMVLPRQAVMLGDQGAMYVMKIVRDHVVKTPVDMVLEQSGLVVIQGHLQVGDQVASIGVAELSDGDRIRMESGQ